MQIANPELHTVVKTAGGQVLLAKRLGVTQQAISKWLRKGWVPPVRAAEIEFLYGVPRQKLMNPRLVDLIDPDADLRA